MPLSNGKPNSLFHSIYYTKNMFIYYLVIKFIHAYYMIILFILGIYLFSLIGLSRPFILVININILHNINCLPCLVGIKYFNLHKNVELFIYYETNLLETFLCDNIRCGKGLLSIFGSFQ